MKKKIGLFLFAFVLTFVVSLQASAQCAMCSINAEQGVKNGNTVSEGLNTGVLYLLAVPYLMALVVGVVWYKKYRKKNIHLNMKKEPFNLN